MEIRYKRDLNSNYMILKEAHAGREGHEVRMSTIMRLPDVKVWNFYMNGEN